MKRRTFGCVWVLLGLLVVVGCKSGDDGGDGGGLSLYERTELARQMLDPAEKAAELIAIGNEYISSENLPGARNCLNDAVIAADEINEAVQPTERVRIHVKLASAWHAVGDRGRCEDAYEEAEDSIDKVESTADKTNILIDLALIKIKLKENGDATKDLKKAEVLSGEVTDAIERINLMSWIAYAFVAMENSDEANRVIESAKALADQQEKPSEKSRLLAIIGRVQTNDVNDKEGGQASLDKALEIARSIEGNPNLRANVLVDIAAEFAAVGQGAKARELLTEAEDLVRDLSEGKPVMNRIEQMRKEI